MVVKCIEHMRITACYYCYYLAQQWLSLLQSHQYICVPVCPCV